MEAKLMSECGGKYIVDATEDEKYQVAIQPGEFIIMSIGFTFDKAAARFTHPNVIASRKVVHHFKHYCHNGRKFWTSRAGVDHYMVIPKSKITMLPEKGYSYVPVMINGVKVKFNVTGGTMDGWTDYVSQHVQTSVNHKLADLRKIAEAAVRGTDMEPLPLKDQDAEELRDWERIVGEKTAKRKLIDMIEAGRKPVLKLKTCHSFRGVYEGKAVKIERIGKWNKNGKPGEACFKYTGAPKYITIDFGDGHCAEQCRAKVGQIDWAASAKALNMAAG